MTTDTDAPEADPTGADPTGADPTGADPTGADPTGANPTGANPTGADAAESDAPTGSDAPGPIGDGDAAGRSAPPVLHLVHRAARRLRLRFAGDVPARAALADLVNHLAGVDGVLRARARPKTGSVILDLALPAETVLDALANDGRIALSAPPKPPPVGQVIQLGLARADATMARQTEGALDLRTALGLLLLGAAILQLARGRVAGPAATLGMAAFSLLDRSRR